jgi:hypothetical protein
VVVENPSLHPGAYQNIGTDAGCLFWATRIDSILKFDLVGRLYVQAGSRGNVVLHGAENRGSDCSHDC